MNHLECVTSKRNQWYWYLLVLILCVVVANVVGSIPLFIIMIGSYMKSGIEMESLSGMSLDLSAVDKNVVLFAMLFIFAVMLIAAVVFIKLIHGRSWTEVINGTKSIRWSRFFFGILVFGLITVALLIISYFTEPENLEFHFEPVKFLIMLVVSVMFIPLQATSEEFLFRGYLAQGVASWTHSRWWALIIPSVLFGLLHSYNPEVAEYGFGIMMTQYIFMGFMFGLISILDDGIELAMGVHTVNNLLGCVLFTYKGSALQTYALFEIKEMNPVEDLLPTILSWIILLAIFAVKYRWNFNVLNQKVILERS